MASRAIVPALSEVEPGCPSDDRLLAFAEGLLGESNRSAVEEHLAGCGECSAVVSATYGASRSPELTAVGRYQVTGEIGMGGMGRVLRARDPSLDRDVAIKLILPSALSTSAKERFTREAMALGKLGHPHVLEVFDAGDCDRGPYFVMEFVEGDNLDVWCRGRSVREILDCLRGAGRGLAAAHGEGILHRDFKPSNVIVRRDGRAKVGDFGLATFDSGPSVRTDGASVDSLTQTGALMGTLPYMAPELLDGGKASTLSDQFAFCVTMYEVLYEQRPFAGRDARELSASIRAGEIRDSPPSVVVPGRAREALARGLSPDPSLRFPSMRALLDELRPRKVTALRLGAGLAAGLGGVVALGALGSPEAPACAGFAERLDAIYGSQVRRQIRAAFEASGLPYAKASSRSTLDGLDTYAERWARDASESCRASERGELDDNALDLRVRCFKHSAQSFEAMVGLLDAPKKAHIQRGGELVAALPDLGLCTDSEALQRFGVLPEDAKEAAEAEALGAVLSEAHAYTVVDDFSGAQELLEQHAAELSAASYPPIRVRAHWLRARVSLGRQELDAAKVEALQAYELAMEHRLDRDASRAAIMLGRITSQGENPGDAQRWFDSALALAQSGRFNQLQAHTLATASRFYEERGELERAVEAARRALELIEDDDTYPATSRAEVLLAYSDRLLTRGREDDGIAHLQEAHELLLAVHGDTHPTVGDVERSLQVRASRRGDYEGALRHAREVLRITLVIDGERSLRAAAASGNLAISLKEVGRFEEAVQQLQHASSLLDDLPAHANRLRVPVLTNLGSVFLKLEKNDAAREVLSRARALVEAQERRRDSLVLIDGLLSKVELVDRNLGAARRLATDALELSLEVYGADHFQTAEARTWLGHVELEAGNFESARGLLARAIAVEDATEADRGVATFLLARATLEDPEATPADRSRAIAQAQAAKVALTAKPAYGKQLAAVVAWLERHAR